MSVHKVSLMLSIFDLVAKCMINWDKARVTIKQPYGIYNLQLTNKINYSDTCANAWIGCCMETNLSNVEFFAFICVCVCGFFCTFKCMRTFSSDVNHKTFSTSTEANLCEHDFNLQMQTDKTKQSRRFIKSRLWIWVACCRFVL